MRPKVPYDARMAETKKTAVLTGGASGIGRALGKALAARGTRVLLADLDGDIAEEAAEEIRSSGGDATSAQVDVSQFAPTAEVVRKAAQDWGRLDYMFNNAGIAVAGEAHEHTSESWRRIIDVNLAGVAHGVDAAYSIMVEQGFGHIVNTASVAGLIPTAFAMGYGATKHAVVGLSKSLRIEAAAYGVRVSVLCPGAIRTPILRGGRHGILAPGIPESEQRQLMGKSFERVRPMDPDTFALKVLHRVDRNQFVIIVPTWWRLLWWMERLTPGLLLRISERQFARGKREFDALRKKHSDETGN